MAFVGTEKKADFNVTSLPGKSSNHTYSLWSGTERANLGIFIVESAQFLRLLQQLLKDWVLKVSDLLSIVMVCHYWCTCSLNLVWWSVWEPWQRYFLLWCSDDHTASNESSAGCSAQLGEQALNTSLPGFSDITRGNVFASDDTGKSYQCISTLNVQDFLFHKLPIQSMISHGIKAKTYNSVV